MCELDGTAVPTLEQTRKSATDAEVILERGRTTSQGRKRLQKSSVPWFSLSLLCLQNMTLPRASQFSN